MKIYHTSPTQITKIDKCGSFDDMLFFSIEPYFMTALNDVYIYSIEILENKILNVSSIFYRYNKREFQNIFDSVVDYFGVDEETAERLIDDSFNIYDLDINIDKGEASWFIQKQQGHIARHLRYEAAEGRDEQGTTYIVPMLCREKDLVFEKKI